jgi:hypothetical protein
MKKQLFAMLVGMLGSVVLVAPAFAATGISFTPTTVSVRQGRVFTLTIGINPQGIKNYTVKTELHYPADLLEVQSFSFAGGWMPLSQSGYDLTDNANGVLIKTGGYGGGTSLPVTFGTVSFVAKKTGNAIIGLSNTSLALDANSQNVLTDMSARTIVVITAPTAAQSAASEVATVPAVSAIAGAGEAAVAVEAAPTAPELAAATQPATSSPLLASVSSIMGLGTNNAIFGIIGGVALLILIGYLIYAFVRRKKRNQF